MRKAYLAKRARNNFDHGVPLFRRQHGALVQEGGALEGLHVRRKVYIILSLTAKALLAWQVFASVRAK